MEKQELISLLDSLVWHQAGKWELIKLVEIKFSPQIKFDIKHHCYGKIGGESGFIDQWNVGFKIHGNESESIFSSPEQVKEYMLNQYDKLTKYLELIGKREKLSERIAPLQKKWFAYADQILELAKTM